MLTRRTVIGMAAGGAIVAIGAAALAAAIGLQDVPIDDAYGPGERASYRLAGPAGSNQTVTVRAESFEAEIEAPGGAGGVPRGPYAGEASFSWTHAEDGESRIFLQNRGQGEMSVAGSAQISTDPVHFTYHVLVITSGVVIIGFSAAFSARRPRGF